MNNNGNSNIVREPEVNTFKDYINLIRANLLPILLISLAGLAVSIIYAVNAQNIYRSTTALKISKPQGGGILSSPLIPEFTEWGSDRFIANELEILQSYTIRENVAKALIDSVISIGEIDSFYILLNEMPELTDSNFISTFFDEISESFKKSLLGIKTEYNVNNSILKNVSQISAILNKVVTVEQKRGLDIVDISVESPSAYEAALIANCYANAYKELNLQNNRQQLILVKEFLAQQREEKLNDLVVAEDKLKSYQEQGGIIQLDEQARVLIEQLTDFESKRNATKIDLTIATNSLKQYKKELKDQDPRINKYLESFATEPYLKSLQEEIARLETQKDLAVASSKSSTQKKQSIKDFESRISELRKKVDSKIEIYKSGIFASSPEEIKQISQKVLETEVKYQALQSSLSELNKIVKSYEDKLEDLPRRTIDLARLEREKSAIEKLYLLVEEKYQEALINEQSTPGNVLIIDPARVPNKPSKPNRLLIVIVGLVLGIGMGIGVAFIRNYFDNTVKTPEDIQKHDINVLAWIPQIEGTAAAGSNEFEFIVEKRRDSIPSEAFRALRTRIQFSKLDNKQSKVLLVTSSAPREGKTTVSINLAGSFAQANKNAIVVDCDLRKPRLHQVMGVNKSPGFTDYFFGSAGYEEIVQKSEIENLSFITAGTIPPNPSEILGSQQMEEFLSKLRTVYDIIVLDSPPVIAVTDAEILSRMVDSTLLVVSAENTEVDLMQRSVELLKHEHGSFIGVVLNNFSYKTGYGSYYKYYYYYSRNNVPKTKRKIIS